VYDAKFGSESLQLGLFGIKIGGGDTSPTTIGTVTGLQIPCVNGKGCTQFVTSEICSQATVEVKPVVVPGTPNVSCINSPIIGSCLDIPGFTPLPNTGKCSFTVSQVICVTIPLDYSVKAFATPTGGACGPVVIGTDCPSVKPDNGAKKVSISRNKQC
jgi:hypothetical protein